MNVRYRPLSRLRAQGTVLPGAAALSALLVILGAGGASAQEPGYDFPPHPGWFTDAGVPVYDESPDGWSCLYFGDCRTEERTEDDPAPDWHSTGRGEPVEISCQLGAFYLITSEARTGWAASSRIGSEYRQVSCGPFDL